MSTDERNDLKSSLASALADGQSCAAWSTANGVKERTAQRWAAEPEVRAEVNLIRRSAIDRAVGKMVKRFAWATDEIARLAKRAKSESVRLAALRSILSDMMAVCDFAALDERIARLEEQENVRREEGTSSAG
jgi:uncharacterized small protein (DUF1192 family)